MEVNVITSVNPDDLEKVVSVAKSFGGDDDDIKAIRAYIKNELEELGDNRILFLMNLHEHGTVGSVQLILKNANSDEDLANGKDVEHIYALQISKAFHRMGFAIKLMSKLELKAKEMGIRKLTLGVDGDNPKAISLYEKLGYLNLKIAEGRDRSPLLFYKYKKIS